MSAPGGAPEFTPPPLPVGSPNPYGPPPVGSPSSYGPPPVGPPSPYGPPPVGSPSPYGPPPSTPWASTPAPQRPAGIAMGSTMAVTASLQWLCALSFAWLVASQGAAALEQGGDTGPLFHILNRFHYRMVDGLAWPLYLLPAASLVTGFWLLQRRPWVRVAHTAIGALALVWSAWLLRDHLVWWLTAATYVTVAVGVLWTRSATAWYRGR